MGEMTDDIIRSGEEDICLVEYNSRGQNKTIKIKEKLKVTQICEAGKNGTLYEVLNLSNGENNIVTEKTTPGRTVRECTCEQATKYCNMPSRCKHRDAVVIRNYIKGKLNFIVLLK